MCSGVAVLAVVLGLTLLAGVVRLQGLAAPDGRMDTDEARLALAAEGVLRTGLPVLPSGRIYTRGLLNAYAIGSSFALLGPSDFAARVPSVVAGALLVPVMFLLGRILAGTTAGLGVAAFTALADPLVQSSRSAWVSSIFLVLLILATYCCYRGFVHRRGPWQVAGTGLACLTLLSYEFAVLLLGGLGLFLGFQVARRDYSWYRGRTTCTALLLALGGVVLFGALTVMLRATTLAGPMGEASEFFTPRLDLAGTAYYLEHLFSGYYVLVGLALVSLPVVARARPRGTTYLVTLLALMFFVPSFLIQVKLQPRYALPSLPLLAVLAAAGVVYSTRAVLGMASSRLLHAVTLLGVLVLFALALTSDVALLARRSGREAPGRTWLQTLQGQGLRPTDLVATEAPTIARFYVGRDDFWIRPDDYERYAYRSGNLVRFIYTGSLLLSQQGDFERFVERPHEGRTVWIIGRRNRLLGMTQNMEPGLVPSLLSSADQIIETRDGWLLLKVVLQRRDSASP